MLLDPTHTKKSEILSESASHLPPVDLRTNARSNPLGIDDFRPEFAWKLHPAGSVGIQCAYALEVSQTAAFSEILHATDRVESDEQFGVRYVGPPLAPFMRYYWRVRVWSGNDHTEWSEPAWFETAALPGTPWQGSWITGPSPKDLSDSSAVYLRSALELGADITRARAYVSSLGWHRFFVNGNDVTGNALVPRWTPLDHAVEYQTYDVTNLLKSGRNVVGLAVGDGRYRGRLGYNDTRRHYGDRLAGFVEVHVDMVDGTTARLLSDGSWAAGTGRITSSDPKHGEHADLRVPADLWLRDATPAGYTPAEVMPTHRRQLIAEEVARVQEVDRLSGTVSRAPSGKQIIDFGQNFAGIIRIRLDGPAGKTVRLTHSELVAKDGELDTEYIQSGSAKWYQRDEVTLSDQTEWYQPWFTIHGFRYVEVDGLDHDLQNEDAVGIVLSSNLAETGTFDSSDARLNQLHKNVGWSVRSNFTDTPTDCPTRERSGWTGDINVFGATSTMFVDVQAFLRRYLRNVSIEQGPDGRIPPWIPYNGENLKKNLPDRFFDFTSHSVGWGDVSVMLPWTLYKYFGDKRVLEELYPTMNRWVKHLELEASAKRGRSRWFAKPLGHHDRYIIGGGYHWGEWLRPGEGLNDVPKILLRPSAVIATAYYAHSTQLMSQIAGILGKEDEAVSYARLSENVRAAWRAAFVHADGKIGDDKQDDYVRALAFDLLLEEQRPAACVRLVKLIERAENHLGTGFLSTPMLLQTLVQNGRPDVAFRLLFQTTSPSWLYQVELGATTVWETWEGYDKKGNGTESHNHYAFGSVAGWLHEALLGISPVVAGYKKVRIAPLIGADLTHASGSVETPYGRFRSTWEKADGAVSLTVEIPPGTSAVVDLEGTRHEVAPGTHTFRETVSEGLKADVYQDPFLVQHLSSLAASVADESHSGPEGAVSSPRITTPHPGRR